ncbi:MAG TPA: hypothetical protein PLB38_03040, partial [bacterium]|nr:hypothetical protein [bacterium]
MKIQKIMKLTLEIIFIVFFSFSFQVNETKARDMKAKMDISEFTYGLTSFTHSNINPIVVTSSDTSGNYDPRFNLAGISPLPDSADHEETLMQQGKDKVFPYINGSTFYKIALLEKMTLWGDASAKQFAQTIINLSKQYTWESEDQRLNSYFLFPTNYQQFLTEKTKNGSLVPASENPLYFFPGISYQAPLTEKVFPDNVITTIRNALKIQENSSNKFYFSIDAVKQLENVSFGACYKINPPGKTNACFNTSKQNCLAYAKNTNVTDDGNTWNEEWINEIAGTNLISLSEMEKKNIYFLHGISCEKVDVLMNNPSSRTG